MAVFILETRYPSRRSWADICFVFKVDGRAPGGGVLPYIRYIGMCRPKGYGF